MAKAASLTRVSELSAERNGKDEPDAVNDSVEAVESDSTKGLTGISCDFLKNVRFGQIAAACAAPRGVTVEDPGSCGFSNF